VTHSGGQPTGGSIDVDAVYDIAGAKYGGEATVTFP